MTDDEKTKALADLKVKIDEDAASLARLKAELLEMSAEPAVAIPEAFPFRVEVVDGDIAAQDVDAVANAANDHLWMGAGVAGAIKRTGGDAIERAALVLGPIRVGSAVATGAGRLKARWVIHGAVMGQDLRTDLNLVRRTMIACLLVADEVGARSIALPAFGTGVGGLHVADVARVMVTTLLEYERIAVTQIERVVLAVHGAAAFTAFRDELRAAR